MNSYNSWLVDYCKIIHIASICEVSEFGRIHTRDEEISLRKLSEEKNEK